eukprot:gnl/TRDRNA2_/TRDRNA2_126648_c0_seq1.p1 gnl/TRDRNA2_/TRDRNA2_126648_c0~~gnl/TRDRNA2_/TRDRNA2_126648_c0_seq1.p1  ORF type:complete len:293 (+),score=49.18 gnl/TRDRNA2_/TRDRNA2_126648_c0_seq1:87-965(+)
MAIRMAASCSCDCQLRSAGCSRQLRVQRRVCVGHREPLSATDGVVAWEVRLSSAAATASEDGEAAGAGAIDKVFDQADLLSEALRVHSWGIMDGFLRAEEADAVHLLVRRWWADGRLGMGGIGTGRVNPWIRSDLTAMLGDVALGDISDVSTLPEVLRTVQERVNMLVMELCNSVPCLDVFVECQPPMFAVYPGGGASYKRHFDYQKGGLIPQRRVCTLILYLNPFWHEEHGGMLRLYPDDVETPTHVDVEPLHGRLLAFLCDSRNQHEVLAAWQPRIAVTWWVSVAPSSSE